MQQKKNKKHFIVNHMILAFLMINSSKSSKIIDIFKGSSKELSKVFKKLQINSNNDEKEITQQQTKKQNINIDDDDDDIHNNPNLHSNEQDEFEIPDDGF
ncbi:unnamed protein product [Rhizophagus irregularis]|nr:unnamed protein product [Rhizophagus irregularis]